MERLKEVVGVDGGRERGGVIVRKGKVRRLELDKR